MRIVLMSVILVTISAVGCTVSTPSQSRPTSPQSQPPAPPGDEVEAERAKLGAEERKMVEAQEYCAIQTDERLGSMGPPLKIMLNDQPVYLCCKGCEKKARTNPDKTLAAVADLKAKVAAGKK